MTRVFRILAISGSLRAASSNTALLQAAARLAPSSTSVTLYEGLARLPAFNPDDDVEPAPEAVADFRHRLRESDAVLISTPEYAHGVPGALKNALDWVVGSGELVDKPIGLLNPSPRSTYAQASLKETLTVMSGRLVDAASLTLSHLGKRMDAEAILADPPVAGLIRTSVAALAAAIETQ